MCYWCFPNVWVLLFFSEVEHVKGDKFFGSAEWCAQNKVRPCIGGYVHDTGSFLIWVFQFGMSLTSDVLFSTLAISSVLQCGLFPFWCQNKMDVFHNSLRQQSHVQNKSQVPRQELCPAVRRQAQAQRPASQRRAPGQLPKGLELVYTINYRLYSILETLTMWI